MKANELRVGNFVYEIFNQQKTIEKYSFTLHESHDINMKISYNSDLESYVFDEIEPIPLTEEWVQKFGFVYSHRLGRRVFYNIGTFFIEIGSDQFAIYYTSQGELICFIKYVHQLQNLYFALTGEELELKNE